MKCYPFLFLNVIYGNFKKNKLSTINYYGNLIVMTNQEEIKSFVLNKRREIQKMSGCLKNYESSTSSGRCSRRSRHHKSKSEKPCKCDVAIKQPVCTVDPDCAFNLASSCSVGIVGGVKIYLFDIVFKNCTTQIIDNVAAQFNICCASTILAPPSGSPIDCIAVIGLDDLSEAERDLRLKACIDGGHLPVNEVWNGCDVSSTIYPCVNRTELFRQPTANSVAPRILLPPGESRIKIRLVANPGDIFLVRPVITFSATIPCCGPIRRSYAVDTGDCLPECFEVETCPPGVI